MASVQERPVNDTIPKLRTLYKHLSSSSSDLHSLSGRPNEKDLELIRTRKPEQPVIEVTLKDGSKRKLWCTFGPQQIDINAFSKSGDLIIPCLIAPSHYIENMGWAA